MPPAAGCVLEVDLAAIADNWRRLCRLHRHGAVAGVVKADAYGLGATRVVPALHAAGCRHFFVACLAEALAIRPLAPDAMVAVTGGLIATDAALYAAHDIAPVLGSPAEIACWRGFCTARGQPLPALLHIDTGLSRLGLDCGSLARLAADPMALEGIDLRYVMTHLVAAEEPGHPLNATQRDRFAQARRLFPGIPASLANSSAIFLGDGYASDLARPGYALYGGNPVPHRANPMRPAVSLHARVLQLRDIAAGDSVGYNATWTAPRTARIATAAIGYADGWPRSLSNRGAAVFDGKPLPLVGRVSMDLATFDATDHPALRPGDWLELIGPSRPLEAVATDAGTNGYEILTSLGARHHRVYRG